MDYKTTITQNVNVFDYIEAKKAKERKISTEISHKDRISSRDALVHCRNVKLHPLNVLLTFEFYQDKENMSNDILRIRKVSHYLRMIFQRDGNRESLMIWSRFTVPNSGIEQCMILTHRSDAKLEAFTKQIAGWKFENIKIESVTEDSNRLNNGRYISVFDEMMKATDHVSRYLISGVYTEVSGPIRGPRVFNSLKLNKKKLIDHRKSISLAKIVDSLQ